MNYIICLVLVVIPLILLFLCNKRLIRDQCKYSLTCIAEEMRVNMFNKKEKYQSKNMSDEESKSEDDGEIVEGFFNGLTSFLSGSTPAPAALPLVTTTVSQLNQPLPPSNVPGTVPPLLNRHYNIVDESLDKNSGKLHKVEPSLQPDGLNSGVPSAPIVSSKFPPDDLLTTNSIKASNKPIIADAVSKMPNKPIKEITQTDNTKLAKDIEISKMKLQKKPANPSTGLSISSLGKCQFYNGKCPKGYKEMGDFSIEGIGSGMTLNCGSVENGDSKPAKAVAKIKDNSINEIIILEEGIGYDVKNPPKVTIKGGKGNGATADAVVDDEGKVKIIKIVKPGYNYTETPQIIISSSSSSSSCHLCCLN